MKRIVCLTLLFASVIVAKKPPNNKKQLEGKTHAGIDHYGTDLNQLMRGMVEIERQNGRRVFFKNEQTRAGTLETRVIVPEMDQSVPQGLNPVGDAQVFFEGPVQSEQQNLPQQMGEEREMALPDKRLEQ